MTYHHAQPARSTGVSTGAASDVKTFASAALLTFGSGMLVMVGYGLLTGFFGGLLGLVAAVFGVLFWKKRHDKIFPATIPTRSVLLLAVVNVLLAVILFVTVD